jgi:hypothetical protein
LVHRAGGGGGSLRRARQGAAAASLEAPRRCWCAWGAEEWVRLNQVGNVGLGARLEFWTLPLNYFSYHHESINLGISRGTIIQAYQQ